MARGRNALLGLVAAALAATPLVGRAVASEDAPDTPRKRQAAVAASTAAAARQSAARMAAAGIVDVPVLFRVRNVNRTAAACNVDGKAYDVRGHLTAPAAVLRRPERTVTLYEHGIAAGEWYWRLDVRGYHHAEEMARRGHASLTIDRLGYDASGKPDGSDTCIGGEADIAHQIVGQLRAGSYTVLGSAAGPGSRGRSAGPAPAFRKVVLAGQSNGGQIAQIAAYSYRDVDGLVIMDWADRGLTQQANARFFTSLQSCLSGGSPAEKRTDPSGYTYYDLGPDEFRSGNFADTEPAVLALAVPRQNRHPCGDMVSQLGSVFTDLRHLGSIKVPVLLMYGERDARVQGGAEQRRLFRGAASTELVTVPKAGHYMGHTRNARMVHDRMAAWLDRHRL